MVIFKYVNHRNFHDLVKCADVLLAPMAYPAENNKPISVDILTAFPWAYKVFLNHVRNAIHERAAKHDLTKILGYHVSCVPVCEEFKPPGVLFLYVACVPDCGMSVRNEAHVKAIVGAVKYSLDHNYSSLCVPSFIYVANTIQQRMEIAEETITAILDTVPPGLSLKVFLPSYIELPVPVDQQ